MKEYKTISKVAGPLIFVEKTDPIGYADIVKIALPDGTTKNGQVLDTSDDIVVAQDHVLRQVAVRGYALEVDGKHLRPNLARPDDADIVAQRG